MAGRSRQLSVSLLASPSEFFAAAQGAFQAARKSSPFRFSQSYRFGPSQLRLETPSPALAAIFRRAFGAGRDGQLETGSQIWAWDEQSTGVPFPTPPWGSHTPYTRRGDIPWFQDPRYLSAYNWAAQVVCLYDREERQGFYWTGSAAALPGWEQTAPMRTLLHWHGLAHQLQMIHGAVVDGLMLAGKGGSGKSTTALACLEAGQPFLCDDYCFVQLEPEPTAIGILASARIFSSSLRWLPELSQSDFQPSDDKIALDLDSRRVREMPIRAILLPQVAEGPVLEKASFEEAIKAVALPTMAQLPGAGPESFAVLSGLCRRLPIYHLRLNRPAWQIPALLKELPL